jgi:hypothetical protein
MCICRMMLELKSKEKDHISTVVLLSVHHDSMTGEDPQELRVTNRASPRRGSAPSHGASDLLDAAVKDVKERSARSRSSQCILPLCAFCRGCIVTVVQV